MRTSRKPRSPRVVRDLKDIAASTFTIAKCQAQIASIKHPKTVGFAAGAAAALAALELLA